MRVHRRGPAAGRSPGEFVVNTAALEISSPRCLVDSNGDGSFQGEIDLGFRRDLYLRAASCCLHARATARPYTRADRGTLPPSRDRTNNRAKRGATAHGLSCPRAAGSSAGLVITALGVISSSVGG